MNLKNYLSQVDQLFEILWATYVHAARVRRCNYPSLYSSYEGNAFPNAQKEMSLGGQSHSQQHIPLD